MIFVRVCSYGTLQAALAAVMTWFNKHEGLETYTDAAKAAAVASAAAAAVGRGLDPGQGSGATISANIGATVPDGAAVGAGGDGAVGAAAGTDSAAASTSAGLAPLPRWGAAAGVVGEMANDAGVPFQSPHSWTLSDCEVGGVGRTRVAFMLDTFAALRPQLVNLAMTDVINKKWPKDLM